MTPLGAQIVHLRCLGHLTELPSGLLHWELFQACPTGRGMGEDPEVTAGTVCQVAKDA